MRVILVRDGEPAHVAPLLAALHDAGYLAVALQARTVATVTASAPAAVVIDAALGTTAAARTLVLRLRGNAATRALPIVVAVAAPALYLRGSLTQAGVVVVERGAGPVAVLAGHAALLGPA